MKLFFLKKTPLVKYHVGHDTVIMPPAYIDDNCEIGNYTYIGTYSNITKAKIGNYCSIGNFVTIGPGEHKMDRISTSHWFAKGNNYDELTEQDCEIGHDVWIGVGAIIRRGVHVGTGAVIGANSFVNSDVPPFAIVAGSPARIIRYRLAGGGAEKTLKSQWFMHDIDDAKNIINNLTKQLNGDK